jgi:hypothetical protein
MASKCAKVETRYKCTLTAECPESIAKCLQWTAEEIKEAHKLRCGSDGRLSGAKVLNKSGYELTEISFVVDMDDIFRTFYVNVDGTTIEFDKSKKLSASVRKLIRNDCYKFFWLSSLVASPLQLVKQLYHQMPAPQAKKHKKVSVTYTSRSQRTLCLLC